MSSSICTEGGAKHQEERITEVCERISGFLESYSILLSDTTFKNVDKYSVPQCRSDLVSLLLSTFMDVKSLERHYESQVKVLEYFLCMFTRQSHQQSSFLMNYEVHSCLVTDAGSGSP